jgi:hypothetical protein
MAAFGAAHTAGDMLSLGFTETASVAAFTAAASMAVVASMAAVVAVAVAKHASYTGAV